MSSARYRRLRDAETQPAVPDPPPYPYDSARPLLSWLLAGDARFTVVSGRTGDHFTVKVKRTRQSHEGAWSYFVWGRGGNLGQDPDLEYEEVEGQPRLWFYIGQLHAPADYVQVMPTTRTSPRGSAVLPHVNWVMRKVHEGWDGTATDVPARLLKSVKCARCRRVLTDEESIRRGLGPECWEKQGGGE